MPHRFQSRTLECLEDRHLLTAVPYGASSQDVAEFLLGDVAVNVVFLESNGVVDPDTERWTPELTAGVKENIEAGLGWWEDALAAYSDVHQLDFVVDYTYANSPIETSYEPISRGSQDFVLWIEEFFRQVDVDPQSGYADEIRAFNHRQRLVNDTNWSFTIFVVNSDNDPNDRFGDANAEGTVFQRAFGYPGGQFIVMPHSRPAATVAHELAHMFWAFDEYSAGDHHLARRGYYAVQNTNGLRGHPDPESREPSIMASTGAPFANLQISQSARETLGWRDSDSDGIFDVLDVPHLLNGVATWNASDRTVHFTGESEVQTLANQNPSGTGNDMTLNRITHLQYRVDRGEWQDIQSYDDYTVAITVSTPPIPPEAAAVEFRTVDSRIGVTSNVVGLTLSGSEPSPSPTPRLLQNPHNPLDVSGDGHVSAIDALQIIISINHRNLNPTTDGPPYLDVSGDSIITSRDVLIVINYINTRTSTLTSSPVATRSTTEELELVNPPPMDTSPELDVDRSPATDAVLALLSHPRSDGEPEFWHEDDRDDLIGERLHI